MRAQAVKRDGLAAAAEEMRTNPLLAGRSFARPSTVCLFEGPDGPGFAHGGLPPDDRNAPRVHLVWSTKGPPPPQRDESPQSGASGPIPDNLAGGLASGRWE